MSTSTELHPSFLVSVSPAGAQAGGKSVGPKRPYELELDGPMPDSPVVLPAYQRLRPGDARVLRTEGSAASYLVQLSHEAREVLYPGVALVGADVLFRARSNTVAYLRLLAALCVEVQTRVASSLPPAERDTLEELSASSPQTEWEHRRHPSRPSGLHSRLENLGLVMFLSEGRYARTSDVFASLIQADSKAQEPPCTPRPLRELLGLSRSEVSRVLGLLNRYHVCEEDN